MFGLPLGLVIKLAAGAVAAAAIAFAVGSVVHAFHQVDADKAVIAAARSETASVKATAKANEVQADISLNTAAVNSAAQTKIAATAAVIQQKVHKHVQAHSSPGVRDARGCVTYGVVRLHDAAALGVDPDELALPAGASDDTCSPVEDPDLAAAIAANYAAYHHVAQELTDLQADVRARVDATTPK